MCTVHDVTVSASLSKWKDRCFNKISSNTKEGWGSPCVPNVHLSRCATWLGISKVLCHQARAIEYRVNDEASPMP